MPPSQRSLPVFLAICLFLAGAWPACAQDATVPDPEKPGPFPVGVTTMLLVDHSRTDLLTRGPRSLMTEVWYPAEDETRGLPKNHLLDFFQKNKSPELSLLLQVAFGADVVEMDKKFQNFSVRDARIRDGLFPLLLFSHGNTGLRMQNAFWCEHMASHGYIVMSPDHTGNAALTFLDGVLIPYQDSEEARKQASLDRPKDLSFLIDAMTRMNKGGDSRFFGRVDLEHIGAAGHSFGGFACTWVLNQEPRVRAAVLMAGAAKERTNFTTPVMTLIATEDKTLGAERVTLLRGYYDESKGPHYSVEFKNAGHFSFTEMYQLKPDFGDGIGQGKRVTNGEPVTYIPMEKAFTLTNGYTTAFFGKFLKSINGYDAYLSANRDPEELIVRAAP